jgi:hypothetical protein
MPDNYQIPLELVEQFSRGNGVIFIGSGLSKAAGLPDWGQLVEALASELPEFPGGADYRDIAQYYEIEFGRNRLVQRVRTALNSVDSRPTMVHEALVALPVSTFVTTNFDGLLEQSFQQARRPYTTVVRVVDANFWSADQAQLVKIHGDLLIPESVVLTSMDYERSLVERPGLVRLLASTLQTHTVLFVGYSVTDPDLRLLLTQLHQEAGEFRRNLYALQFDTHPLAVRDLDRRGVRVIDLRSADRPQSDTLLDWFEQLSHQVARRPRLTPAGDRPASRVSNGRLADEVIGMMETAGYAVSRLSRGPHAVDFLAAKHSEGVSVRRWVRCVEGSVASAQVEEALLLRDGDDPAEVWFIAYRGGVFTRQARALADQANGVRTLSRAEFYRTMLNIDAYLERLLKTYESEVIEPHWVDLAGEVPQHGGTRSRPLGTDTFDSVEDFLDAWIDTPGRNHISILGDFGTGKTWLCRHYAAKLARRYLADCEHNRVPVLISLRDRSRADVVNLQELITDTLVNESGLHLPGGYRTFQFLNRHDSLVLIFDGFDEMQLRLDDRATVRNFDELAKVIEPDANCKAILTCRTGYFRTDLEEREILAGEGLRRVSMRARPNFEVLRLLSFDEPRIKAALKLRLGAEADQYYSDMRRIYDLADLAHRPILLNMIAFTLPQLIGQHRVSQSMLYETYTDEWLQRNLREERSILTPADKRLVMQELAWAMFLRQTLAIHYSELPRAVAESLALTGDRQIEHYEHDLRTQSFLQRDAAGYYSFGHKSFMEFFIAQRIFVDIVTDDSSRLAEAQTSHETDQFITDMLLRDRRHLDTLISWMSSGDGAVLRVNAAGILAKTRDPDVVDRVIQALRGDQEVRHLYLTAVLFRVLEIKWEAAARLALEADDSNLPNLVLLPSDQLRAVADRFCSEALNPRDGVARWLSLKLLQQVSDLSPDRVSATLDEAAGSEPVAETQRLIAQLRAR